jgi:hypothetical protein
MASGSHRGGDSLAGFLFSTSVVVFSIFILYVSYVLAISYVLVVPGCYLPLLAFAIGCETELHMFVTQLSMRHITVISSYVYSIYCICIWRVGA